MTTNNDSSFHLGQLIVISAITLTLNACCSFCFTKADLKPTSKINPDSEASDQIDWEVGIGGSIEWGVCQDEMVCRSLKRMRKDLKRAANEVDRGRLSKGEYSKMYAVYNEMVILAAKNAIKTTGNIPVAKSAPGSVERNRPEVEAKMLGASAIQYMNKFNEIAVRNGL